MPQHRYSMPNSKSGSQKKDKILSLAETDSKYDQESLEDPAYKDELIQKAN